MGGEIIGATSIGLALLGLIVLHYLPIILTAISCGFEVWIAPF